MGTKTEYLIDDYINNNLVIDKNPFNNYQFLYNLCKIIEKEKNDFNFFIDLLNKYDVLLNSISVVVSDEKLLEMVLNSDDEIIINLFEAYANIKEIDLYDVEDNKDYDIDFFTDDSVKLYLHEISKYKLLSKEEERKLFIEYNNGDDSARRAIINSNLKLVVSIAKRFIGRGLSFLDLIQEGNIGLMKAVDRYDVSLGFKFSTYSTNWIRQSIGRAIADTGRNIRIPVHIGEKIKKLNDVYDELRDELGMEPNYKDIAKKLEISEEQAKLLYDYRNDTVSLNEKITFDDDSDELEKFVFDSNNNTEDIVIDKIIKEDLLFKINNSNLSFREKEVIFFRYGFVDGKVHTLEEIGTKFNITRERIRQLEAKALRKLAIVLKSNKISKHIFKNNTSKSLAEILNLYNYNEILKFLASINIEVDDLELLKLAFGEHCRGLMNLDKLNEKDSAYLQNSLIPRLIKLKREKDKLTKIKEKEVNNKASAIPKKVVENEVNNKSSTIPKKVVENSDIKNEVKKDNVKTEQKEEVIKVEEKTEINSVKKKGRKFSGPYKILGEFPKELIDLSLTWLNEDELYIVHLRYGEDFDNPHTSEEWYKNKSRNHEKLYVKILPKLRSLLTEYCKKNNIEIIYKETEPKKKDSNKIKKQINDKVEDKKEEKDINANNIQDNATEEIVNERKEEKIENEKVIDSKDFTDKEKVYLLGKLKEINYDVLRKYITEEEAIIITLILGVNNKQYKINEVSKFFNKSESEIILTLKKVFNILKDIINKTIDDSVLYLLQDVTKEDIQKLELINKQSEE